MSSFVSSVLNTAINNATSSPLSDLVTKLRANIADVQNSVNQAAADAEKKKGELKSAQSSAKTAADNVTKAKAKLAAATDSNRPERQEALDKSVEALYGKNAAVVGARGAVKQSLQTFKNLRALLDDLVNNALPAARQKASMEADAKTKATGPQALSEPEKKEVKTAAAEFEKAHAAAAEQGKTALQNLDTKVSTLEDGTDGTKALLAQTDPKTSDLFAATAKGAPLPAEVDPIDLTGLFEEGGAGAENNELIAAGDSKAQAPAGFLAKAEKAAAAPQSKAVVASSTDSEVSTFEAKAPVVNGKAQATNAAAPVGLASAQVHEEQSKPAALDSLLGGFAAEGELPSAGAQGQPAAPAQTFRGTVAARSDGGKTSKEADAGATAGRSATPVDADGNAAPAPMGGKAAAFGERQVAVGSGGAGGSKNEKVQGGLGGLTAESKGAQPAHFAAQKQPAANTPAAAPAQAAAAQPQAQATQAAVVAQNSGKAVVGGNAAGGTVSKEAAGSSAQAAPKGASTGGTSASSQASKGSQSDKAGSSVVPSYDSKNEMMSFPGGLQVPATQATYERYKQKMNDLTVQTAAQSVSEALGQDPTEFSSRMSTLPRDGSDADKNRWFDDLLKESMFDKLFKNADDDGSKGKKAGKGKQVGKVATGATSVGPGGAGGTQQQYGEGVVGLSSGTNASSSDKPISGVAPKMGGLGEETASTAGAEGDSPETSTAGSGTSSGTPSKISSAQPGGTTPSKTGTATQGGTAPSKVSNAAPQGMTAEDAAFRTDKSNYADYVNAPGEVDGMAGMSGMELVQMVLLMAAQEAQKDVAAMAKKVSDNTADKGKMRGQINAAQTTLDGLTNGGGGRDDKGALTGTAAEQNTLISNLEGQRDQIGDDNQILFIKLQNLSQQLTAVMQAASNVSKSLYDTEKAIIGQIGR